MRRWNDLYNMGNDYPQYIIRVNRRPIPPSPPAVDSTDLDILFDNDKLVLRFLETEMEDIDNIEVVLIPKENKNV